MTPDAWLTLVVVLLAVAAMATDRAPAPFVVLSATTALLACGVIDTKDAFAGFSNSAPIAVGALYILAAGAEKSGLLDHLPRLLGPETTSPRSRLLRLLTPTAFASSILNNTPIVAMVAPTVVSWARRTGRSPSTYLMPISFAAILGGLITTIGTSTNLVVSGLLESAGQNPFGMFEIGWVGLPVALAGLAFLIFAGPHLVPDRRAPSEDLALDAREFTVEMTVESGSPLVGRTISEGGLRNLDGVYLVEVERSGRRIAPVSPDEPVEASDRLTFAGNIGRILDLQQIPGLVSAEERHFPAQSGDLQRSFFEVVVAEGSPLVNSTLKRMEFRSRYGGAVVAIHRASARIRRKLGKVVLRPGDLLVVLADDTFLRRVRSVRDFLLVAPLAGNSPRRREKQTVVVGIFVGLMTVVSLGFLEIVVAALLAAIATVVSGVLTPTQAGQALNMNVLIVIAGSFGLGSAVMASGLDGHIAATIISPLAAAGDTPLLLGVLVAVIFLSELVTNNAAAVLMFPVALATAEQAALDPRPFAIAVALGASASFLSPLGYQTNTMVYAMGGYRFADFARAGFPLTIIVILVAALVLPVAWPLR